MTHNYFAMPYNISVPGFPFTDYDSYAAQAAALKDSFGDPVEEFSIECLDGDNGVLFNALEVTQAALEQWFDDFECLDGDDDVPPLSGQMFKLGFWRFCRPAVTAGT